MDIQRWLWFGAKTLSFVCLGAIVYVLFCIKGL